MIITTVSAEETQNFGHKIGETLTRPAQVALGGELGAGKTCLAQGILRGLGVSERYITSPSYTLVNQYESPKGNIFHCDLYRLETAELAGQLLQDECFEDGIIIIEWAEKIIPLWQADYLRIKITRINENTRQIEVTPYGKKYLEFHKLLGA